jgi:hypothetical protein
MVSTRIVATITHAVSPSLTAQCSLTAACVGGEEEMGAAAADVRCIGREGQARAFAWYSARRALTCAAARFGVVRWRGRESELVYAVRRRGGAGGGTTLRGSPRDFLCGVSLRRRADIRDSEATRRRGICTATDAPPSAQTRRNQHGLRVCARTCAPCVLAALVAAAHTGTRTIHNERVARAIITQHGTPHTPVTLAACHPKLPHPTPIHFNSPSPSLPIINNPLANFSTFFSSSSYS